MKKSHAIALIIVIGAAGYLAVDNGLFNNQGSGPSLVAALPELSEGHYEGWAIYGEEKISTGKFDAARTVPLTLDRDLREADSVVVTIEPEGDTDAVPSGVVVLAGEVVPEGDIALSFPINFAGISGSYILATPTNGDESDETSGIWFLTVPPPLEAGLVLPVPPSGWVYEGWGVTGGTPLSSGRFTDVAAADAFDGFSGTDASGPAFPGEDYLENAPEGVTFPINLADGKGLVVVSVEPDIDGVDPTGDGPFALKPLVHAVPEDAADHTNFAMDVDLSEVPSGVVRIQ